MTLRRNARDDQPPVIPTHLCVTSDPYASVRGFRLQAEVGMSGEDVMEFERQECRRPPA